MMSEALSVSFADVQAAAARLRGVANNTPVVTSRRLNALVGGQVFLKCENFQRAGAFKFRGAWNALSLLSDEQKQRGVLAFSSGNHAQAVALSGQLMGVRTTIVMPQDAPAVKRRATEGYGASVVLYDPATENREEVGRKLAEAHGFTVIPPYNHPHVIAGQGTAAYELIDEVGELDVVAACVGGGGLLGGTALAVKGRLPACRVVGAEPDMANDATLTFKTGVLHTVHNPQTIADGTRTPSLGTLTRPIFHRYVGDMVTISEEEIREAVRFAFHTLKLVVEPSGVLALAALLTGKVRGQRMGVIISGGNVDGAAMADILRESP